MYGRHKKGVDAEHAAKYYLERKGLRTIQTNYRIKGGELDLVMRDQSAIHQNILVFVEVRYRADVKFGGAAASVTAAKQRKLNTAARHFIKTHAEYDSWPARFDVVAITGLPNNLQISWLPTAFEC